MKKLLYFVLFLCLPFAAHAFTLKDKLLGAKPGDFVVTEQNKIFSILVVRSVSDSSIDLEEISIPASQVNPKKTSWRSWIDKQAPGHTSWMLYQIDFIDEKLTQSYSFSERKWLYADDSNYLLAQLLMLPLSPVEEKERRRIGPPPEGDDQDQRALWNPPMVRNSTKVKKPRYDTFKGKWPKDSSQLSECSILFYFDTENPTFPFPYWLELSNGHITLKMRTIDSGCSLTTPLAHISPPPPFNFIKPAETLKDALRLTLLTVAKESHLQLYARDLTDPNKPLCLVSFNTQKTKQKGYLLLDISKKTLLSRLKEGHQYQWIVKSKSNPEFCIESNDRFTLAHDSPPPPQTQKKKKTKQR